MGGKWHFSVVLICTSLNMCEFDHFSLCLTGIVIFVNCPFLPFFCCSVFFPVFTWIFVSLCLNFQKFMCISVINYFSVVSSVNISPSWGRLSFDFVYGILYHANCLQFPLCKMGFPGGSEVKAPACNLGHLGWEDSLEKEMATHSSILAWRIPWTEEPGGLQSMGSQRVGHD